MYRRFETVLVVLLVATAGCVGGFGDLPGDGGDGANDGGAGGGDGASSGGAADDGASGDGTLANRTAVLADAGSYTSTWRMTVTEGDVVSGTAYTSAVDFESERSYFRSDQTSDDETTAGWEVYHAEATTYNRYGEGESASYVVGEGPFTGTTPFDAGSYVTGDDDLSEFDRTGRTAFDGVEVNRYVLTERPGWIAAQQLAEGEVRWTDFEFEVLVDDDGVVRAERWTATGTQDGETLVMEFSYEVTGIGTTTVDEPAWVATARDQAA